MPKGLSFLQRAEPLAHAWWSSSGLSSPLAVGGAQSKPRGTVVKSSSTMVVVGSRNALERRLVVIARLTKT